MNEEFKEFEGDPETLALARRLSGIDFSAESRVRFSLRARLLLGHRNISRPALAAGVTIGWALAGLIAFVPLWRALKNEPSPTKMRMDLPGLSKSRVSSKSEAGPAFETLPVGSIFATRSIDSLFETRGTSIEELFVKPAF